MRIPFDAIIPVEKLTHYLLVLKQQDDKSKFLSQAGFTLANWEALLSEIRFLIELLKLLKIEPMNMARFIEWTVS